MLILYHHPYSQHARRVAALLDEESVPYETVHVALEDGEHMSPEFLAINPNHQVPTLDDGQVRIHESNAILRYLCAKHDLTDWYPPDPAERAQVDQWLDWNQSRLAHPVAQIVVNALFMGDNGDADAIAGGKSTVDELAKILEAALQKNTYLCGDAPTIADLSVASNITQLQLAKADPQSPAIRAWYERVCEIPGFRRTLPQ